LDSMDEEDKEEIVDKIEGTEEDGMGDFNPDEMGDEEPDFGDEMGDEEPVAPEGEMGEASKHFGSFDDEEWTGDDNKKYGSDDFDFDFDVEEFDDIDSFRGKHPDMDWFEKGSRDSDFFNKYKEKHNSPLKVRTRRDEMGEGFAYDDVDEVNPDDFDFEEIDIKPRHSKRRSLNHPDIDSKHAGHIEDMIEGLFTESKVDIIIEGYFKIDSKEKQLSESKKRNVLLLKEERKQKISKIKKLSESISQEVGSIKFLNQNPTSKLIGKTNKKNLVFEMKGNQYRVDTKGQVL